MKNAKYNSQINYFYQANGIPKLTLTSTIHSNHALLLYGQKLIIMRDY